MTAPRTTSRHDRRVLADVGWRAAVVVAAAVAVALELPAWGRLPLSVAAVVGVATFLRPRSRRPGLLDVVLVVAGGGLVALALLGLALNVLPTGIGPLGWALAIGVLELAVLGVLAVRRPLPPTDARRAGVPALGGLVTRHLGGVLWGGAAALVLVGAVVYSSVSYRATHVAPLAIAAVPHGDSVAVTVSAGTDQGPYELDLVSAAGRRVLATSVRIAVDEPYSTSIAMPAGRAVLQLVATGSTTPVRQLILDGRTSQ